MRQGTEVNFTGINEMTGAGRVGERGVHAGGAAGARVPHAQVLLPASQGQNLALTVLHVPSLLDSGWRFSGFGWGVRRRDFCTPTSCLHSCPNCMSFAD